MVKMAIIVLLAFFIQTVLTIIQIKSYQKNLSKMMRQGKIIIGRQKGMLSSGCVILIRIDDGFNILESRYMKGMTVFNRFRNYNEIVGKNVLDFESWKEEVKKKQVRSAIANAIEIMYERINQEEDEREKQEIEKKEAKEEI